MRLFFLFIFFLFNTIHSQEIIIDKSGNYFLMKSDGTFKKLPKPSPGKKYIVKKRIKKVQEKNIIFKKVEKKSRTKGNQGIR